MGIVLRSGVTLSALLVLTGGIIYLLNNGHTVANYHSFLSEPGSLRDIKDIFKNALMGKGRFIIQLGVLVLIATPIARIIFGLIGYLAEKDYLYTFIALFVLCIIIFSL